MPDSITFYIVSAILLVLIGIIGFVAGFAYRKKIAEKEIGSAEEEATRILNDAIKAAETKKREAVVEAREEVFKIRAEADKEIKERRSDVQKQEPPDAAKRRAAGPKVRSHRTKRRKAQPQTERSRRNPGGSPRFKGEPVGDIGKTLRPDGGRGEKLPDLQSGGGSPARRRPEAEGDRPAAEGRGRPESPGS